MISHEHECIFTHVPKTAGKSIRSLFGLPEFESDYRADGRRIDNAFGHKRLVELAEKRFFANYFKFAFVRNPFDRLVSAFFYLIGGGCNEVDARFRDEHLTAYKGSFSAFVEDLPRLIGFDHFIPQFVWVCDSRGSLLTDFVGRYENLRQDISTVGGTLRVPFEPLPVLNASTHDPYQSYYQDEGTKARVARAYGQDLELFSYRFG